MSLNKTLLDEIQDYVQKFFSSQVLGKAKNIVQSGLVNFSFEKGSLDRYLLISGIVRDSSAYETRISLKYENGTISLSSLCNCIDWSREGHCAHSLGLLVKYLQQKFEEVSADSEHSTHLVGAENKGPLGRLGNNSGGVHVPRYGTIIDGPIELKGGRGNTDYGHFTYLTVSGELVPFSTPVDFTGQLIFKFYQKDSKGRCSIPIFEYMNREGERISEVSLFESLYLYNWQNGDVLLLPNEIRDIVRKVRAYRYDYSLEDYLRFLAPLLNGSLKLIQIEINDVPANEITQKMCLPRFNIYSASKRHFVKVVLSAGENELDMAPWPNFLHFFFFKDSLGESFSSRDEFAQFLEMSFHYLKTGETNYKKFLRTSSKRHVIDEYVQYCKNEETSFRAFDGRGEKGSFCVFDALTLKNIFIDLFDNWGANFFKNSYYDHVRQTFNFEFPQTQFFLNFYKFYSKLTLLGVKFFYQDRVVSYWQGHVRFERIGLKLDWFDLEMKMSPESLNIIENMDLESNLAVTGDQLVLLSPEQKNFLTFAKKYKSFGKREEDENGEVKYILPFSRARVFEVFELQKLGGVQLLTPEEQELCERLQSFDKIPAYPFPPEIKGSPRPYQLDGYYWLRFLYEGRLGACLADDMGLGKTFQTIIFLQSVIHRVKRVLVVCPVSILYNWTQEFSKFSEMSVEVYYGGGRQFNEESKVIITSYGVMKKEADGIFNQYDFDILILDEVQNLKNAKSLGAKAGRKIAAQFRLCLTGTPVENDVAEFYNILDLAVPGIWGTSKNFQRLADKEDRQFIKRVARPFILRRTKGQVINELPDKIENLVYLSFSEEEEKSYQAYLGSIREVVLKGLQDRRYGEVLKNLLRLRQLCLWQNQGKELLSSKVNFLMENLPMIVQEGHKTLVFSQFTQYLDTIEKMVMAQGISYSRIDGTQSVKKRQQEIENFQNGPNVVFLISLKAGGVGLNLTAASYIFLMDPWWNPAVESQAIDRAHRIGQKNQVTVYRPIIKNSVEEKVLLLQEKKRELFTDLMSTQDESYYSGKLTVEDFQFLFS